MIVKTLYQPFLNPYFLSRLHNIAIFFVSLVRGCHMHLFTLHTNITATSLISHVATLVAFTKRLMYDIVYCETL